MNETELIALWHEEKPKYKCWGNFVSNQIKEELTRSGKDLDTFLKIPPECRLKDDSSLVDKAFYRPDKSYADPYYQIEDKVGVRFVVLLLEDIEAICRIVTSNNNWGYETSKHFDEDKQKSPLLFTYQSVHFVLRPKKSFEYKGLTITSDTTCELQIRTLLQHAHAELTHDAIYKAKKSIKPGIQRTVAKCMALIETTDDFFTETTKALKSGSYFQHRIIDGLNELYKSLVGREPHNQKSSLVVWDSFEQFADEELERQIREMFSEPQYQAVSSAIVQKLSTNSFYQQSIILFIYWMLVYRRTRLLKDWPLERKVLDMLANDIGVPTWNA